MIKTLSVDDMLNGKASVYPLVIAVSKRAREITDDMILRGEITEEKAVNIAIDEFRYHMYTIIQPD